MVPKYRAVIKGDKGKSILIYSKDHDVTFYKNYVQFWQGLVNYKIDYKYLMQSTGQKDCNNSKIFDVDILLEPWKGYIVGRVFYSLGDLAWKVLLVGGGEEYLSDCLDLQVCGNIHENPELLEVTE